MKDCFDRSFIADYGDAVEHIGKKEYLKFWVSVGSNKINKSKSVERTSEQPRAARTQHTHGSRENPGVVFHFLDILIN